MPTPTLAQTSRAQLARKNLIHHSFEAPLDDFAGVGVSLHERLHHEFCLLIGNVWRDGRDIRIRMGVDPNGSVCAQSSCRKRAWFQAAQWIQSRTEGRRHIPLCSSYPNCSVNEVRELLRGGRHLDIVVSYVFEQVREIHLLLLIGSKRKSRLLSDDRQDRLMVEFGVVQTI
jgi:hypothetical protein